MFERKRMEAEFALLEVIGRNDERAPVSIERTLAVPYRWICLLEVPMSSAPNNREVGIGTGVLIGPRHVLTSAHVLVSREDPKVTVGNRLRVQVARNGRYEPFNSVGVRGWQVDPRWISKARPKAPWLPRARYDLGLVTLASDVGALKDNQLGGCPLSWFGAPGRCGHGSAIGMTGADLTNGAAHLAGYPHDKGRKRSLWEASGSVRWDPQRALLAYDMDTSGGQSGAPVWIEGSGGGPRLVGIHSRVGTIRVNGSSEYVDNLAAPLTPEAIRMIESWKSTFAR